MIDNVWSRIRRLFRNDDQCVLFLIVSGILVSRLIFYIVYVLKSHDFSVAGFIADLNIWDSVWYASVAVDGYASEIVSSGKGGMNWNFFPLDAYLVGAIWRLLGGEGGGIDIYAVAVVVNTTLFGIAAWFLYRYIMLTRENFNMAVTVIAFLTFGVYSFYFSAFYSESLYILLFTLSLYFMVRQNYLMMGVCGALFSMTRSTGILFCFCVLVYWIEILVKKHGKNLSVKTALIETVTHRDLVLGTTLVPLGLFVHMLYLRLLMGDGLAFVHTQTVAWGRTFKGIGALAEVFSGFDRIFLLAAVFFAVYLLVVGIQNKRYYEVVLPFLTVLIAGGQTLLGFPRYLVGCVPFILFFAEDLEEHPRRFRIALFVFSAIFECILLWYWYDYHWILT